MQDRLEPLICRNVIYTVWRRWNVPPVSYMDLSLPISCTGSIWKMRKLPINVYVKKIEKSR